MSVRYYRFPKCQYFQPEANNTKHGCSQGRSWENVDDKHGWGRYKEGCVPRSEVWAKSS